MRIHTFKDNNEPSLAEVPAMRATIVQTKSKIAIESYVLLNVKSVEAT